jgi:hypothetical protein
VRSLLACGIDRLFSPRDIETNGKLITPIVALSSSIQTLAGGTSSDGDDTCWANIEPIKSCLPLYYMYTYYPMPRQLASSRLSSTGAWKECRAKQFTTAMMNEALEYMYEWKH